MKNFTCLFLSVMTIVCSCTSVPLVQESSQEDSGTLSRSQLARLLSELPLGEEQLNEVYDAVSSSSGNGYDEEYLMSDLLTCPGKGVGEKADQTKAASYSSPIKDLMSNYLAEKYTTKGGAAEAVRYLEDLASSDLQIYWPYSEDWNGDFPIITFDPGYGAESNVGYRVGRGPDGLRVVDSLIVTEEIARQTAVWVINSNDDSAFTPFDFYTKANGAPTVSSLSLSSSSLSPSLSSSPSSSSAKKRQLLLQDITLLRNFDSWFGGASEIMVKMGAVDGFKATSDEDLKLYSPSVTDFVIVIKRKYVGTKVPFESILLTDFTDQMEKLAFLLVEDDGGTTTSWKCSAVVKFKSKSWGFEIDIPYRDKDDIVWRGQLDHSFFNEDGQTIGRFGDAIITFRTE